MISLVVLPMNSSSNDNSSSNIHTYYCISIIIIIIVSRAKGALWHRRRLLPGGRHGEVRGHIV